MDVIDLLSDSDDSVSFNEPSIQKSTENDISITKSIDVRSAHPISDDEFDFPEVPFACQAAKITYTESKPAFPKTVYKANSNIEEELLDKYVVGKTTNKPTTGTKNKNGLSNGDKEIIKIQKLKNAEDAARKKAEKAATAERLKSMKPGECMKYMKVIVDSGFQDFHFFDNLISQFQGSELEYHLKSQLIPHSITWRRTQDNCYNNGQIPSDEKQIIIVWDYVEAVKRVSDDTFVASILSLEDLIPGKVATLVIYGIESYFKHHKNLKKQHIKNQCQGNARDITKRRGSKTFKDLPVISRKELELCLTEIQLRINCNSQLVENPEQLGLLISQYTKAIAEAPFKMQKKQATEGQLDWYSAAGNRDTVRVDKDGNGLKRLWQQQLCQFNLAKLETAEAIISQYPTPLHLMEAYARCTPSEGAKLLQDIAIRRTAGPLTAVRRIGPELSKKLYLMFTAEDGDVLLGNEGE